MCTSSSPSTTELPSASTSHSRSSTGTLAPSSDSNSGILQVTEFLSSWILKIWSKVFLKFIELFLQCIQLKLHIHYYSFFNHYRYFYFSVTNMKGGKCRMNLALFLSKAAALKKGSSNYSTTTNSDCVQLSIVLSNQNPFPCLDLNCNRTIVEQGSKNSDTVQPISVSTIYSIVYSATRLT